jgi:hypothetical protein
MIDYPEGLPCWAPGAANYLESILTGEEFAWEWGGGASSVWLAPKVREIMVMEHDPKWELYIYENRDDDQWMGIVIVRPWQSPEYVDAAKPDPDRPWDPRTNLWLIDGFRRIDCLALVEKQVRPGDIVVLDDALDYAEHLLDGPWKIKRFAQPHPHAGIPINHKKYGHRLNTVRKVHADTKETWVCLTA